MFNLKNKSQDENNFRVMKPRQDRPYMTQRDVALKLGVSQGCQKALIFKGWDKVHNFNQNKNMLGHVYRLTPAGIADEALFTARFLKREMLVEQELKVEVEMLKIVVTQSDNTLKHP